jgi:hypothetical protein
LTNTILVPARYPIQKTAERDYQHQHISQNYK